MLKVNTDIACNIDNYPNLSLEEILSIEDINTKMEMLKLYRDYIKNNMTNRISKNIITKSILINNDEVLSVKSRLCIEQINKLLKNKTSKIIKYNNNSILEIENMIQEEMYANTSMYLFPGDIVLFYPLIREYKATSNITCDISGSIIRSGTYYASYRPLIDDITTREHYVLDKSIKTEISYTHLLPKNILEFEEWIRKVEQSYSYSSIDDEIDFYSFSANYKSNLNIKKLRDRKRRSY
jgi:hypothetical protein